MENTRQYELLFLINTLLPIVEGRKKHPKYPNRDDVCQTKTNDWVKCFGKDRYLAIMQKYFNCIDDSHKHGQYTRAFEFDKEFMTNAIEHFQYELDNPPIVPVEKESLVPILTEISETLKLIHNILNKIHS